MSSRIEEFRPQSSVSENKSLISRRAFLAVPVGLFAASVFPDDAQAERRKDMPIEQLAQIMNSRAQAFLDNNLNPELLVLERYGLDLSRITPENLVPTTTRGFEGTRNGSIYDNISEAEDKPSQPIDIFAHVTRYAGSLRTTLTLHRSENPLGIFQDTVLQDAAPINEDDMIVAATKAFSIPANLSWSELNDVNIDDPSEGKKLQGSYVVDSTMFHQRFGTITVVAGNESPYVQISTFIRQKRRPT